MSEDTKLTDDQLRDAVTLLLQREEERRERAKKRSRLRARRKQKETEEGIARLARSIEIIKWCVLSISGVMAVGLLICIMVIMQIAREAERIKGEVASIQREAELIRDKIRHPLETIGGMVGRQFDSNLGQFIAGDDEE